MIALDLPQGLHELKSSGAKPFPIRGPHFVRTKSFRQRQITFDFDYKTHSLTQFGRH